MKCSKCGGSVKINNTYTKEGWRTSQGFCMDCSRRVTCVTFEAPDGLDLSAYQLIKRLVEGEVVTELKILEDKKE